MADKKARIVLVGAKGRLGSAVVTLLEDELRDQVELVATIDRASESSLVKAAANADSVLDVSIPAATEKFLGELAKLSTFIPYVIGCTGWTDQQLKTVHQFAERAPVVLAPNFSPGVNLLLRLIEQSAPLFAKWGYDVVVHETHHTRKLDSPSGTAKAIVSRLGNMKPQVHASRAGNIIGTHAVHFVGPHDLLKLEHEALDRSTFARGAIMAAEWAARQQSPGLYSMKEVIFGSD